MKAIDVLIEREQKQGTSSATTLAANVLREAILRGLFPSGMILRQSEMAKVLGISHIPVREAIRKLEMEGFVEIVPNRGAIVKGLTAEDIKEIFYLRKLLEAEALRLAIPNMNDKVLRKCTFIDKEISEEQDINVWCGLNWEFHESLYMPSQKARLIKLMRSLYSNIERYLRLYLEIYNYRKIASKEHSEILEACRKREVEQAVKCLLDHLDNSQKLLLEFLEENEGICLEPVKKT